MPDYQSDKYDSEVMMISKLAQSAGFGFGYIGLVDCSNQLLVDTWIGQGKPDQTMTAKDGLNIISRVLKTSLSLTQDGPKPSEHKSHVIKNTESLTRVRSSRYMISIGDRIGNIASMAAFVTGGPKVIISEKQRCLLEVGLTYANQLLHESIAPPTELIKSKIQETILQSISSGLAVLDADGSILYITDRAIDWLGGNIELNILNDHLVAQTPLNRTRLQQALTRATTGLGKISIIQLQSAGGPLKTITVLPMGEAPKLALLIFGKKGSDNNIICDQLLKTLGLTVAERRLAQQLLSGRTLAEAAIESNLTISTARSYLKVIFAKTGIHRQSELITLYHKLLPPVQLESLVSRGCRISLDTEKRSISLSPPKA
jgi:DNA-binding CsgD family transcriptional regulator/PAS domain-containing protein